MTQRRTDKQMAAEVKASTFITQKDGVWVLEDSQGNELARSTNIKDLQDG